MQLLSRLLLALVMLALLSPVALADGVTVTQEQERARSQVNKYRTQVGQPRVAKSSALNSAAYAHSRYIVNTGEYGHYETQTSSPYYTGYKPLNRANKFGYYNDSITENFQWTMLGATGTRTYLQVDNAVQWWMSAIYHRFAIISPRTQHIGYGPYYGAGRAVSVLDFGGDYGLTGPMVQWPRPDATGVGTILEYEKPNPVAQFGGSFPTGYPVSITWYKGSVTSSSMTMKRARDGLNIPGYGLTPQNDQYHYWSTSLSFIPKQPLAYSTRYTVTFKGTFSGTPFSYTWSFTTQPAPGRLSSSTPTSGATGVSRTPSLQLNFTRLVRSYTLVRSPYSALTSNGIGMSLTRTSDNAEVGITITQPTTYSTKTVSLSPSTALAANTRYRLMYTLADYWGRPQRGTLYFTTGS